MGQKWVVEVISKCNEAAENEQLALEQIGTDALLREIAHRELKEYKKNQSSSEEGQQRDIKVQCKLCPKKMLPKNLNENLLTIHNKDRKYIPCTHSSCKETFSNLSNMRRHFKHFHKEKEDS